MKFIRLFSRILIGVVFIFSGFVKVIDPLGSAYKFEDYFTAFRMEFMEVIALPMGIVLASFELLLGIVLILGYRKKTAAWVALIFISFFTLLTFILAIFNPVTDCGCFGDAIIMTNWETFFKNLVLILFAWILFSGRKEYNGSGNSIYEWSIILMVFTGAIILSIHCFRHLPLIDFRPFSAGTNIETAMEIPDDAPADEYETHLYYKNLETGKTEQFTISNYPKDTMLWQFMDSESKLVTKGYEPQIEEFSVIDCYGNDVTDEILSDMGYSLLMVTYDLEKSNDNGLFRANEWAGLAKVAGDLSFYAVTSSSEDIAALRKADLGLEYNFFNADEILLKTIIRSNPGFMLIKNGVITGKWGFRDLPEVADLNSEWPDLIEQTTFPQSDEELLLMEEGIYEEFDLDIVKFDRDAMSFLITSNEQKSLHSIILGSLFGLLLFITLVQLLHHFITRKPGN